MKEKRKALELGVHVISGSGNRREVVLIERDINPGRHSKRISTTYHEFHVGNAWLPNAIHNTRRKKLLAKARGEV